MKKFIFIFLSALLIVSASGGCSWLVKNEPVPIAEEEETQLEKLIGIVSNKGETGTAGSTVLWLETDQVERIYITSATVNLKKYLNRRVEVEGKFNEDKSYFIVENTVSLGNETSVKSIYQNSELGIKFSFPSVWALREEKNISGTISAVITPYEVDESEKSTVDVITIERSENNKKLSASGFLGLNENYLPAGATETNDEIEYQKSAVGVAALDSVKKTIGSGAFADTVKFYISRDSFIYIFSHKSVGDSDKDILRNAFYDIVASFEFIPVTQGKSVITAVTLPQAQLPVSENLTGITLSSLSQSRTLFINYIKTNISALAPEPATMGGSWFPTELTFASPEGKPEEFSAIYAIYEDGHDLRRILLSVPDRTNPSKSSVIAYFKPGASTDWALSSGADSARSLEKVLINLMNETAEIPLKSGYTLLDASRFEVKIQYPSPWYWAYINNGYNFSDKPLEGENVLIRLTREESALPPEMADIGELNGKPATEGEYAEAYTICIQGASNKYCLSGIPEYKNTMRNMLETLQE